MLIGNKVDLKDKRVISTEKGKNVAEVNGCSFCEISCKENKGIEEIIIIMLNSIIIQH